MDLVSRSFDCQSSSAHERISADIRNVTAGLFVSLDGVTESPHQWQFDRFDEEMMCQGEKECPLRPKL